MASNNNINVTLGQWEQDIAAANASSAFDVSDYTRITTYADLVKKTISLSSEVRHDLNIDDNDSIDNIFVVNGRKTLTYQQLSHSSNVKVYLRESPTAKEKHLYRFNGEDNHLPKFSCDNTYIDSVDGEKEYDYNQCVLVEDVSADMITNMIRFRFDNITFRPEIRFVSCNDDGFAEDASVVNYMDLINPHDVYVNMTDGRKGRFSIGASGASGLSGKLIYQGSEEYYTGSVNEYQYQYGGDVSVTYSVFNTMSQPIDLVTAGSSSIATTIDVEPYHHRAYVNMSGHRNKTSYVYIQTDGHVSVRDVTNAQPDSYDNIDKVGTIIVLPPERAGYCRTDVANPAQLKLSIQSQSVESYNRYKGYVYVYDKDEVEKFNGPINIKYFENEYILDLNSLTGNRIKPDYSTLLQLETVATFKKTKVRVTDWYNMAVTYVTDFDPETGTGGTIHNDVSTVQRGQKYIHTFWTEEQNVLTPDYVGIKVAVTEDTVPPEDKTIGYGKDLQIAKISLKSNINSFVRGFNASNFAMIPYKHNKPSLPNVLDLYLRLLPKISVKFYLPTGFLVSLPNKNVYQGGTCVLEYDAENVTGNSLSFDIKRDMSATSMNMLTGQFYYNETGSGTPVDVIFERLSEMFSTDEKKTVIVSPITFVNTTFSIRMTARRVVGLILHYFLPKFVDAYTLEETFPALNKGGYLGSRRTNYSDDSDLNGYGWINFNNSINAVQSEDVRKETSFVEGSDKTEFKEEFHFTTSSEMLLRFKRYNGRSSIGYLPTCVYDYVKLTCSQISSLNTNVDITNDGYSAIASTVIINMSSSSSDTVELNLTPNLSDKGTKVYLIINNVNMEEGFTATLIPKYVTPSGELIAARTNTNFRKNGSQYELVVPEFYQITWDGLPRGFAFNFTQNEIPEGIIPKKYLYTYDVTISSKKTSESSWNLNYSYEGLSSFENFQSLIRFGGTGDANPFGTSGPKDILMIVTPIASPARILFVAYEMWTGVAMLKYSINNVMVPPIKHMEGSTLSDVLTLYINCQYWDQDDSAQIISFEDDINDNLVQTSVSDVQYNPGSITIGSETISYTHIAHVKLKDNMVDVVDSLGIPVIGSNMDVNFNAQYKYIQNGSEVTVPAKVSAKTGPVVKLTLSADSDHMSQEPSSTLGFTIYAEEWYKSGDNIVKSNYIQPGGHFPSNGPGYTLGIIWQYYVDGEETNKFSKYFNAPVYDQTQGTCKLSRKSDAAEDIGNLIVTLLFLSDGPTGDIKKWYQDERLLIRCENFMNVTSVGWWDGQNEHSNVPLAEALLSPVSRGNSGVATVVIKFTNGHGLDLRSATITSIGPIHVTPEASTDNIISASITISQDLGIYNDDANHRIFYTGMPVPFVINIGTFTDTFYIKLGPVISFHNTVATGWFSDGKTFSDRLNLKVGEKIVLQSRAHEWYSTDNGATIVSTPNSAVGSNDNVHRGRTYGIEWRYNNGSVLSAVTPDTVQPEDLASGDTSYQYTRQYKTDYLLIQHAATWNERVNDEDEHRWNDGGAWRVSVYHKDDNFQNGSLTANVSVSDSNTVDVSMYHWYDNNSRKTTELSVSNLVELVGSRYWINNLTPGVKPVHRWVDCGENLDNLILGAHEAWHDWAEWNIEIYLKNPGNGTFEIDFANESDNELFNFLYMTDADYSGGVYDGTSYDVLIGIEMDMDMIDAWKLKGGEDDRCEIYSGRQIPFILTGTFAGGQVETIPFTVTVGRFGEVVWNHNGNDWNENLIKPINGRQTINDDPINNYIIFETYADIVEETVVTVGGVEKHIGKKTKYGGNTEYAITSIAFSDRETQQHAVYQYGASGSNPYGWTIRMSTYDEASPSQEPLFWGRGTITVVTCINAPWYETETRTIGFERYMNFYVPENTYSVDTKFVLADIHTSTSDLEFWVQNRPVLTNRTNDRHCFDSVIAIKYNGYNTNVQFMTFKVTIGDDGHAEIRRVRATNMTGDHTAMYFGFNRPTGTSRQAMTSDDNDFFTKAPNISPFAWYGMCSLVKNDTMGPSSDGSFYRYEQLPSTPMPRMPIFNWNLLQTIYSNSLDDCPIWTQQWQEQYRT